MKGKVSVDLGPNTVIVGQNQKGKTALLDALSAAILGKHPLVRGGAGEPGRWLEQFSPPNDNGVEVVLEGPQGPSTFKVWKEGRSVKKTHDAGPMKGLPVPIPDLVFAEALLKEGNTMQNTLIRRWGEGSAQAAPEGCTEALTEMWAAAVRDALDVKKDASDTELLAEVVSSLGRKVKALGNRIGEAKRRMDGVDTAQFAGTELLPQKEQMLQQARDYEKQSAQRLIIEAYDHEEAELQAAIERLQTAQAENETKMPARSEWLGQQAAALEALGPQLDALAEEEKALADKATFSRTILGLFQRVEGGSNCVLCGSPADTALLASQVQDRLDQRIKQIEGVSQRYKELESQKVTIQRAMRDAEQSWTKADAPLHKLNQWVEQTRASLATRAAHVTALRSLTVGEPPVEDVSALEAEVKLLQQKKAAKDAHSETAVRITEMETEQAEVKSLEKLAKRKAKGFAESAAKKAEAVVAKYVTGGMKVVYDRKANAWQIGGATRDGRPHSRSASGFERNLMLPALFLAWTEDAPRFAVLDDSVTGTYDGPHLKQLLDVLKDRQEAGDVIQNFVVLPPALVGHPDLETITEGWKVIEL